MNDTMRCLALIISNTYFLLALDNWKMALFIPPFSTTTPEREHAASAGSVVASLSFSSSLKFWFFSRGKRVDIWTSSFFLALFLWTVIKADSLGRNLTCESRNTQVRQLGDGVFKGSHWQRNEILNLAKCISHWNRHMYKFEKRSLNPFDQVN